MLRALVSTLSKHMFEVESPELSWETGYVRWLAQGTLAWTRHVLSRHGLTSLKGL